jgi:AcrR family transcriptional regulator
MGQGELQAADDTRDRLIQTARAMVLRGDNNFTIAALCSEAVVDRGQFRMHFSGKTALMAALMHDQVLHAVSAAPVVREPESEPQTPKAEQEPSVPTPDAWLERRLRVFERALTALETRAETSEREQARVIAQLEEKIAAVNVEPAERQPDLRRFVPDPACITQPEEKPEFLSAEPAMVRFGLRPVALSPVSPEPVLAAPAPDVPARDATASAVPAPVKAAHWSDGAPIEPEELFDDTDVPAEQPLQLQDGQAPGAEILSFAPSPVTGFSKQEMADVLESARARARAAAVSIDEEQPKDRNQRVRWLAIGALSLVALFVCISLVLGNTAAAIRKDRTAVLHGEGTSRRHDTQGALAQTIASADFGDAKAEARLALAYLRGQGVARDASAALRWTNAAAQAGEPTAEYLLGALYQQGDAVKADPAKAFVWFQAAAAKGNLKAMHNLAIAYSEGLGTAKDQVKAVEWFTSAAERGYVDSAFDLAVMYERGAGVPQDLGQALKWYDIAAKAGDKPSKARADFLRGQMNADDARRAANAAMAFDPLPALPEANRL